MNNLIPLSLDQFNISNSINWELIENINLNKLAQNKELNKLKNFINSFLKSDILEPEISFNSKNIIKLISLLQTSLKYLIESEKKLINKIK